MRLKYTPAGGSVTVSAGLHERQGPSSRVEDTGPGIPEAERQRVRQRFYRLPNSPGHGSGLGLAIVDEIARLYGATDDDRCGSERPRHPDPAAIPGIGRPYADLRAASHS